MTFSRNRHELVGYVAGVSVIAGLMAIVVFGGNAVPAKHPKDTTSIAAMQRH